MKHLFGTTALAALLATSALAQSTTTTDTAPKADQTMKSGSDQMAGDDAWMKSTIASGDMEILVSDLIGHNIYTRDAGDTAAPAGSWDAVAEPREDWRDLGEVDDVLMSTDGKIDAIVSDVGGFLGMGEREVRITLDNLAFVPDTDDEGEFFVVFKGDPARFGEEATYDRTVASDAGYRSYLDDTRMRDDNMRDDNMQMAQDDADWDAVRHEDLTADDLQGARVYGPNHEDIGEIGELILDSDGKITQAVVDVGGWLGMGEKPVAIGFDQLKLKSKDGEYRAYVDMTEEQMKAMPEYAGG